MTNKYKQGNKPVSYSLNHKLELVNCLLLQVTMTTLLLLLLRTTTNTTTIIFMANFPIITVVPVVLAVVRTAVLTGQMPFLLVKQQHHQAEG